MNRDETKTILLVEDEAIIALAAAGTLKRYGFKAITVFSGEEAIQAVAASPEVDLVLMDIDLGSEGMDGTQAAEIILKQRDLPLVFLSAHTERQVVEKTEGITSYGYIVKNSGETVLIASIKMAFRLFDARKQEMAKEAALRQSEENLRVNIARLSLALEAAQAGVWAWDVRTDEYIWSDELWKVIGLEPYSRPASFETWQQIVHPDDWAMAASLVQQGAALGEELDVEFRVLVADNSVRTLWVRGRPLRGTDGQIEQYIGIASDITRRKHVEDALKASEETFRSIVRSAPVGIHLYQLEDNNRLVFTGFNPFADRLLGVDHAQFIGQTIEEAFPPLAETDIPDHYRRAARQGESWHDELIRYDHAGIRGVFEVYAFQISPGKMAVMFNDITTRKPA
jgi:PAS domain S-box-containing protein